MANFYNTIEVISGTLLAGSAITTTDSIAINGYTDVTTLLGYTRAGAGGAIRIGIDYSPDNSAGSFYQIGVVQAPAIVAGNDNISLIQRQYITYTSTGAGLEQVTLPTLSVVGGFIRFRVNETGAVGTPGAYSIKVYVKSLQ